MAHTCHAYDCNRRVPPEMFMCRRHWFMLPRVYRSSIWQTYRPGQCDDMHISKDYAEAAKTAIKHLAYVERKQIPEGHICLSLYDRLTET